MDLTKYHAKIIANQLSKRYASDSVEKFSTTLSEAQVDLNPHQIDAALFAFKSPLSSGAILADEVGLGKTIEAGIIASQMWAERKRKILIIVPASLRKQWKNELKDKFFLPSIIIQSKEFDKQLDKGNDNPYEQDQIAISSYRFSYNKEDYISTVNWDLVIFDEAHRLRNVYKDDNKIATSLKYALYNNKKILLTATPLQNTLLEFYGLSSFIDERIFGDVDSFREQFSRVSPNSYEFDDLKKRISTFCKRTLREQVQEYVKYTNRIAITIKFETSSRENELYNKVSSFLQRDKIYSIKPQAKHLLILILRKLLASSTYAIGATLLKMADRLEGEIIEAKNNLSDEKPALENKIANDFEQYEEIKEEWDEDFEENEMEYTFADIKGMQRELAEIRSWAELAFSIKKNTKGEQLIKGLNKGFKRLHEIGANEKAVIFTESRKTQKYLYERLSQDDEYAGKIVTFNGTNKNKLCRRIYKRWVKKHKDSDRYSGDSSVDMRNAIIDHFRNHAKIMIATEAAGEGINLQFCSLVINYDLPWNPQRVEQRIGRCHRYGQKYDVVVVNFINLSNEADRRVYELLEEKSIYLMVCLVPVIEYWVQ